MKSDIEDVTFVQRLYMRIELVSCLRIERGRDEDGVTSPFLVNFIQSSVILSNHKDFVLMLLPGEANQPVVEERQVRIAHCAYDHSEYSRHFEWVEENVFGKVNKGDPAQGNSTPRMTRRARRRRRPLRLRREIGRFESEEFERGEEENGSLVKVLLLQRHWEREREREKIRIENCDEFNT